MDGMDTKARRAWNAIRECVARKRYIVLPHFIERMDQRGYFWPDVLAIIDEPTDVRSDGLDRLDRPKWIVSGKAAAPLDETVEIVCVLDKDDRGRVTVFITIY
ncbi:MAG: hypothetical protein AABZ47_05705 [Planctomycetota bacterium]